MEWTLWYLGTQLITSFNSHGLHKPGDTAIIGKPDNYREGELHTDITFGPKDSQHNFSFTFHQGTFYTITGPNGAGKTTLLKILSGELSPNCGEVTLADTAVHRIKSVDQLILLGEPVFYPELSVGEHLALLVPPQEDRYHAILNEWDLTSLAERSTFSLSSGERQRAFLATQLSDARPIVMLDEPERHLDSRWVKKLSSALKDLSRRGHLCIVATHSDILTSCSDETITL
ncbi:ATP-binding cassette domain-containing protein [Corynebacterium uropygiale]|uniref:ATP-binding cassette domain-containing protein n=1 Tax=Corynebacterium uropygiale TaxID=1775911 RepID=A0A9X1U6D5_9CORY|nr:ATP-binding cassette domain-containing protein [Corynebacterium uropygiale]MCF4005602.1 ATP-binding cassette domain-containing protein [Corynebacterium uropygiale]